MAIADSTLTWYALRVFFSDKSDLKYLDFRPIKPSFSMAQVEWKGVVLNQVASLDKSIVDLSHEDPTNLVFDLFGPLSFVELFQLHREGQTVPELSLDWNRLFKLNSFHFSQRTEQLFESLALMPNEFIDWARGRQCSAQDLMPLISLKTIDDMKLLSVFFSEKNLTRNEGKKVLDLLVDLLLLGKNFDELKPKESNWLESLQKLRTPMTQARDEKQKISDGWPRYVQVQKMRTGDQLLHRMQITFSDNNDLSEKLSRLSEKSMN